MGRRWKDNTTVTLITESSGYTSTTDISDFIYEIPLATDTGGDEINEAVIVLNGGRGKFLTVAPILADYDRIRIQSTDESGSTYDRIFEIAPKPDAIIPSEGAEGTLVTLNLLGIEYHVQLAPPYLKSHFFENPFNVVKDIGASYNTSRGSRQPQMHSHDADYNPSSSRLGNDAPEWITGLYQFGLNPASHWERISDMEELMMAAVINGGAFDVFGHGYDTHSSDFNRIDLRFFSFGSTPVSNLTTIEGDDSSTGNIQRGETEGGRSPPTATIIAGWFSDQHGSLPVDYSRFFSADLTFEFRPEWSADHKYKVDSRVRYLGNVYKRITSDVVLPANNPAADANWVVVDEGDEFGDSIQYSPWTDDKADLIANGYTRPDLTTAPPAWATSTAYLADAFVTQSGTQYRCVDKHTSGTFATDLAAGKWVKVENTRLGQTSGTMLTRIPDCNIVIIDDDFFRTWVNYSTTNPVNVPAQYKYGGTAFYRGFRVLCNGNTGFGDFAGTDKNGVTYPNSVVEYDGAKWAVKYKAVSTGDGMQVVDLHAGIVYEWNDTALTWDSLINEDLGMDCLHPYDAIYNAQGPDSRPEDNNWGTNQYSGVEMLSKWSVLDQRLLNLTPTANQNYYKKFAGFAFWFPYPLSTYNGIGETVGQIYGGSTSTGQEPATLDTENMHMTPTGQRGMNKSDSEAFGPLNSLEFILNFHYSTLGDDDSLLNEGDFKFRAALFDTEDNVIISDFTIPFNHHDEPVSLPLQGFKNYRARRPRYDALELVPPKEIEVVQRFNWRNVKLMTIHWLDNYDKFGRYFPEQKDADILGTLFNISKILGENAKLNIDALHFKKPLLKITSTQSTRAIWAEPIRDTSIISYDMANNITYSQLEKEKFKHHHEDIETNGVFGIRYGDSFYYHNSRTVSQSDNGANTIKLVLMRAEHSFTSRGMRTRLLAAKRFTS